MKPPSSRPTLLLLPLVAALALPGCCTKAPASPTNSTYSSFDVPKRRAAQPEYPSSSINLQDADPLQVLALYQEISGRTVVRPATLPMPRINVRNETPLTRIEALQLLDTVLAQNGIAMVLSGDAAIKAVQEVRAVVESPPEITLPVEALPDSGSFMMRTVQLKKAKPSELIPVLMPFAKTPNALLPIDASNLLIIRDYSSNVRQMLQVLQKVEGGIADSVPATSRRRAR